MNVSALDENGKPVDWWFIYKVPELSAGANSDRAIGYEYVYYDASLDKAHQRVDKWPYLLNVRKRGTQLFAELSLSETRRNDRVDPLQR